MPRILTLIALYFLQHCSILASSGYTRFELLNYDNLQITYFSLTENSSVPGSQFEGSWAGVLQPGRYYLVLSSSSRAYAAQIGGNSMYDSSAFSGQAEFSLAGPVAESISRHTEVSASATQGYLFAPVYSQEIVDPADDLDPKDYSVSASTPLVSSHSLSASGSSSLESEFILMAGQASGFSGEVSTSANAFASSTASPSASLQGRADAYHVWAFRLDAPTAATASTAVPEPTVAALILISASLLCSRRRLRAAPML